MSDEVQVWIPRDSIPLITSDSTILTQSFVAVATQTLFTLTKFAYVLGAEAVQVFKNGLLLTPKVDWVETSTSSISLTAGAAASDEVVIVGYLSAVGGVGILGTLVEQAVVDDSSLIVTITAALLSIHTGTPVDVQVGDKIDVAVELSGTKGGTAGEVILKVSETGTTTVEVYALRPNANHNIYRPASIFFTTQVVFRLTVTTAGSFDLNLLASSAGSDVVGASIYTRSTITRPIS